VKKGFTDFAVGILIPDFPGQTALWYAEKYLEEVGSNGSDAKDQKRSLANTLDKQVREGKETRVKRERIDGKNCYFPVVSNIVASVQSITVQIPLTTQELGDIDNLVSIGKFKNKSDAIKWLVAEGIKAHHDYLDKVEQGIKQIEQLKKELTHD